MKILTRFAPATLLVVSLIVFSTSAFAQLSGSWTGRNTILFDPRADFTAAAVNNIIYVIGGQNGGDLQAYNPALDSDIRCWSSPTTTGTLTGRTGLTSAVVSGKIYVIGGFENGAKLLRTKSKYSIRPQTYGPLLRQPESSQHAADCLQSL
jgi:hypothetical protein